METDRIKKREFEKNGDNGHWKVILNGKIEGERIIDDRRVVSFKTDGKTVRLYREDICTETLIETKRCLFGIIRFKKNSITYSLWQTPIYVLSHKKFLEAEWIEHAGEKVNNAAVKDN